jgi:Flp pilus assembly protein TadB
LLYLVKINKFIIVLVYVLLTLTCNSADNNLEQEKLPSYQEAQMNSKIQQSLSELKKHPPSYTVAVYGNNSKELNDLAVDINLNENNNNLNNEAGANNRFNAINSSMYRNFNICWCLSIIATTIIVSLLTKSIVIVFVVAIAFCLVYCGVVKLYIVK